jgi:hypothetical protein
MIPLAVIRAGDGVEGSRCPNGAAVTGGRKAYQTIRRMHFDEVGPDGVELIVGRKY